MPAITGRIASLGSAQELLIQDEVTGAPIGDMFDRALHPSRDRAGKRLTATGPFVRFSPEITLALSMTLRELATNAVKYGALSTPVGRVAIQWSIEGDDGERHLAFSWAEHEGPEVTPPARTGFGTRMIERVLRRHARGDAVISYLPGGVRFEVEGPV